MKRSSMIHSLVALRSLGILAVWAIALVLQPGAAPADDETGFVPIFNGQDLDGWDGNPDFWSVKDGAIVGQTTKEHPTKGNTFLIWRQGPVDDFVLRASFKLENHNSGIQYRSKEFEKWVVGGYQADMEEGQNYTGIIYEERGRGILAPRGKKVVIDADGKKQETEIGDSDKLQDSIKKGDWNEYEIMAEGNHLIQCINGKVMSELVDNQADKRALSGILALQLHAGPPMKVEFKNIRLKRTKLADVEGIGPRQKVVLVAGMPSHGSGEHEFGAGTLLLQKCLDKLPQVATAVYHNGWPKDPTALDNADTIVLYMDGGSGHPLIQGDHLATIDRLMKKGVGLCCLHYAVEVPKDKGGPELLKWIGGYYETGYSINPHWDAAISDLPKHSITRGVRPFTIRDEWYYSIRFPEDASGVKPLLVATPPDDTRQTAAAKSHPGRSETLAWALERPDGGRGFGFTGAHFHKNWQDDSFRKFVLNAILWTAKAEVPPEGVASEVTADDLKDNLDPKPKR